MGQISFLEVRLDPEAGVGDEAHHRAAHRAVSDDLLADLRGVARDTREGRAHDGSFEVESGTIDSRLCCQESRVALRRDVRVPGKLCLDLRQLLLRDPNTLPGHVEVVAGGIVLAAGNDGADDQLGLPLELGLGESQVGPGKRQLLLLLPVAALQAFDLVAQAGKPRLRLGQRYMIGPVVDTE
jgi:hypothetical protein